jgi:hypothetical protein
MDVRTDIDMDFFNREPALEGLKYVFAVERGKERKRHASGVYFHDIPVDPTDDFAVWNFEEAEAKGYFKLDFLHNTIYKDVRNEDHLITLLTTEPPWDAFLDPEIVKTLAHVSGHLNVMRAYPPRSISDLAVCISLSRPGKKHLIGRPRAEVDAEIWKKTEQYHYKKSHATAYAASIVVQLNLMVEKLDT